MQRECQDYAKVMGLTREMEQEGIWTSQARVMELVIMPEMRKKYC